MTKANQERQDRLAQALRANLHRRKAQSRARKAVDVEQSSAADAMNAPVAESQMPSVKMPEGENQDG